MQRITTLVLPVLVSAVTACAGAPSSARREDGPAPEPLRTQAPRSTAPRTHRMTFAGPSMEPLLADGEPFTLVEATAFERGDVVVFLDASQNPVAKRVVAIAGDVIAIEGDVIRLNGELVPTRELGPAENAEDADAICFEERLPGASPYVTVRSTLTPPEDVPAITVPEGHVFVLGDHRDRSQDSRYGIGSVPLERVAGSVVVDGASDASTRLTCPEAPP